jgi:hypothetical protein
MADAEHWCMDTGWSLALEPWLVLVLAMNAR